MKRLLGVLIFLVVATNATYLNIKEPVESTGMVENSTPLFIGTAGPGQTIYIVAERSTIDVSGERINYAGWDKLAIEDVPAGWTAEDSPWYETPMKAKIKISPDAKEGRYKFKAKAVDEGNYDGLGNLTVTIEVAVSKEIFTIEVSPYSVEAGVGQPAVYYIDIDNGGAASDTFSITSTGVPAWKFRKDVLAPHAINLLEPARKTVAYEVVSNEQNEIDIRLNVTSLSSSQISAERTVKLRTRPSLVSDYKATGHGLLIFPLVESPIYSLIAFFSKLLL